MSLLRVNRIHYVSLGLRMVYGPRDLPVEQLQRINYYRKLEPGEFKYDLYRHYLHVQLDEIIHKYANAEDPFEQR